MIEIDERRRWNGKGHLLLVGPGAAGKSTLGPLLAPLLHRRLVDLDSEFSHRNGQIGTFIGVEGYDRYKQLNSALAEEIITSSQCEVMLVTSSGFLTPDNPPAALESNLRLLAASYSICLLPSRDLARAVSIIVGRQLQRPFARGSAQEAETIQTRFSVYVALGDMVVFSESAPGDVAQALADCLREKLYDRFADI